MLEMIYWFGFRRGIR